MSEPEGEAERALLFSSERAKTFIDAVVAIAMTLLILPLMESVNVSASHHEGAWTWVDGHTGQLLSFALSFMVLTRPMQRLFARMLGVGRRAS